MTNYFGYRLSYFRTGEPSSIDIWVNTDGKETHGFQIVADVVADPQINLVDQDDRLPKVQLSVDNIPGLNFITNQVEKNNEGYKIGLAAITSNPKVPFKTDGEMIVAKLIFTQPTQGSISINLDQSLTKMPLKGGGEITFVPTDNEQQQVGAGSTPSGNSNNSSHTIATSSTGSNLQLLSGSTYVPPAVTSAPSTETPPAEPAFSIFGLSFGTAKPSASESGGIESSFRGRDNQIMIILGIVFIIVAIFIRLKAHRRA